jgi:predicted DNA-binding WGR domain protein
MPTTTAPPPLMLGNVENPAHMPGPKDIPGGNPEDPAPAPGTVPRGDSRSLRRGNDFALVYRVGTCVITRTGTIGTRGQWRVVEYPTSASAANSFAKEASRFVTEGFSDYRE